METKNLNQPLDGVFFNEKEDTATFSLKNCGKDEYIDTIKALLDMLGNLEHDYCFNDTRSHICNLISSMLPDKSQIINPGEQENELFPKYRELQDNHIETLKTLNQQTEAMRAQNELVNSLKATIDEQRNLIEKMHTRV